MTPSNVRLPVRLAAVLTAGPLFLAACGDPAVEPGEFSDLQHLAETCPADDRPLAMQVRLDLSGSMDREALEGEARQVVEDALTQVAVCGGRASVYGFTAGSAHSQPILEQSFRQEAATQRAHLRQVPEAVEASLEAVDAVYPDVAEQLDPGTDVFAQFTGAAEFASQMRAQAADARVEVVIATDGITTQGAAQVPADATVEDARALAESLEVPDLSAIDELRIVGIGQVASGDQPSSQYVAALTAFYQVLAERSGVQSFSVVTEYQGLR